MSNKPTEERYRKRYHKNAHDRKLRDQFWMKLPFEAKGLLSHIECMVASTIDGYASGVLYGEDGSKISVDEFLFLIGDGSNARDQEILEMLKLLCRARQLNARKMEGSGTIQLLHWSEDQETRPTGDSERHARKATREIEEAANSLIDPLKAYFDALGNRKVTEGDLLSFIKARSGFYLKKQKAVLQFWYDSGVLSLDSSKLASLAPPPLVVGVGGDLVGVGVGGEYSPPGNIPADQDQDQEKGSPLATQWGPGGGGGSARSEHCAVVPDSISVPVGHRPDVSDSPPPVHLCRGERPIQPAAELCDHLHEPGDAFRVEDAVQATERLLCNTPGWNSVPPRKDVRSDPPLSQHALLALNHRLREAHGPKVADEMWRTMLHWLIAEMIDRRVYRKAPPRCWTAVFSKRLRDMSPADVAEVVR